MLRLSDATEKMLKAQGKVERINGRDAARARVRTVSDTVGLLDAATTRARSDLLGELRRARRLGASLGELGADAGLSRARIAQLTAGAYLEGGE